jgi:predicted AAA+ superfamily ATPase
MIIRWLKPILEQSLNKRRVIIVSGPRQCGKTTLSKQILKDDITYRTLDDVTLLKAAFDDPISFISHNSKTLIIDEIQKCPLLISAIKQIVDINTRPGQFLLTGSSDIMANPEISESLAGRVKNLRLRAMSSGEVFGINSNFLDMAFYGEFPDQINRFNKTEVTKLAMRGGYPEVLNLSANDRKEWHRDYANTLITRDLRELLNIRRSETLRDLLYILASWSSKFMDIGGICSKLSLTKNTFETYVNLLQSIYLFEKLKPWIKTDYDRVGKKEKIFMTDTGLMSSLLYWKLDNIVLDPDKSGKLYETLVFNELATLVSVNSGYELYHYRDRENREIDFILENEDGDVVGIEVKSGSIVSGTDFKHLKWFKEKIAKDRKKFKGIILYSGENTVRFGNYFIAVPIGFLLN